MVAVNMPKSENKRKDREALSVSQKDFHNYASTPPAETPIEAADFALTPLPESPSRSPLTKKGKTANVEVDPEEGTVAKLSAIIISRGDALEKAVTMKIEGLKKTIDFVCEEVKDIKKRIKDVEAKTKMEEQWVVSCENRIAELERYSRRWNLRLAGVPEDDQENVKAKVIDICQKAVANENVRVAEGIDVAHRLGPKDHHKKNPRNIIIRFLSRSLRDSIWKNAKHSSFLKPNNMCFAEDLTAADRERRATLWPLVQQARAQGKTAYFVAGRAYVNGAEIFPSSPS